MKPEERRKDKQDKKDLGKLIYNLSVKYSKSLKQEDLDKYVVMRKRYREMYGEEYFKK